MTNPAPSRQHPPAAYWTPMLGQGSKHSLPQVTALPFEKGRVCPGCSQTQTHQSHTLHVGGCMPRGQAPLIGLPSVLDGAAAALAGWVAVRGACSSHWSKEERKIQHLRPIDVSRGSAPKCPAIGPSSGTFQSRFHSSPSWYRLGAVTEVVHVLPVMQRGPSLMMWPAREERSRELCCGIARGFKLELRT